MRVDPERVRRYLSRTTPRPWRGWREIGATTDGAAISRVGTSHPGHRWSFHPVDGDPYEPLLAWWLR